MGPDKGGSEPGGPKAGGEPGKPGQPGPHGPSGPGTPNQGFRPGMPPPRPGQGPIGPPIGPPPPGVLPFNPAEQTQQVLNGIAKLEHLRAIQTGVFHYHFQHPARFHQTAPVDRFGLMEGNINIDFGARTVGGGNSFVKIKTIGTSSIDETVGFPAKSFAGGTGDAIFEHNNGTLNAKVIVENADGVIAGRARLDVQYSSAGRSGNGVSDNQPRLNGPAP